MRSKITVAGGGSVGVTTALLLAQRNYADIILIRRDEKLARGQSMDIFQAGPLWGYESKVFGTNNYEDAAGSEIVVITTGTPRKPGMSRDDLVLANMEIVKGVVERVASCASDSIIIMVANPLDAMTYLAFHISKFPRNRITGMSGVLDSARFKTLVAQELGVAAEDVQATVLGGHGDTMVPIPRLTTVSGIPITELFPEQKVKEIMERTIKGGGGIVSLLGTSASYAPAAGAVEMIDSIVLDKKRILPCSVYLQGEYGIEGIFVGVPVKLGKEGVEEIIEIRLTSEEGAALRRSAAAVQELVNIMKID